MQPAAPAAAVGHLARRTGRRGRDEVMQGVSHPARRGWRGSGPAARGRGGGPGARRQTTRVSAERTADVRRASWPRPSASPATAATQIEAYLARPLGPGPFGGVVVIHHMPGYDARHQGDHPDVRRARLRRADAEPVPPRGARRQPGRRGRHGAGQRRRAGRAAGRRRRRGRGLPAGHWTAPTARSGSIGYCSGGRQSFLAACSLPLDAAVDCYGAFVVGTPPEGMPLKVGPIVHLAPSLSCPLLGLFGAEDQYPSPEQVDRAGQDRWTRPARSTSSTATRAPGTPSSRWTGPPTGRRPRTTAGRRSGTSSAATWQAEEADHVHVPDREDRGRRQRQGRGRAGSR